MRKPIALDLFSGCGGLTLGLKRAGFRIIGAIDNDPLAVETYKKNHPDVHVWQTDIQGLKVERVKYKLKLRKGQLDLLVGCPPCQSFSRMRTWNKGRIVRDKRSKDLVFVFLRFAEKLLPKAIMMENVPGLASDKRIRVLCEGLTRLGYECQYRVLDAADYRVPQRRRRMILLAGYGREIQFAQPRAKRRTVRDAIGELPHPNKSRISLHICEGKRSERIRKLIGRVPRNGGSRSALGQTNQLSCHQRCDGFRDVYGRMSWNAVAPTVTGGCLNPSKGRFLHPTQNRAITLREAALLQSFPRRYYFSLRLGRYRAAELVGNAFPPQFATPHAIQVKRFLQTFS